MERLSIFTAVASEVVASLVSRYEKAHSREKWGIVVIFLYFCGLSLTSYGWWKRRKKERKKKDKMEIFVAEYLDFTKG